MIPVKVDGLEVLKVIRCIKCKSRMKSSDGILQNSENGGTVVGFEHYVCTQCGMYYEPSLILVHHGVKHRIPPSMGRQRPIALAPMGLPGIVKDHLELIRKLRSQETPWLDIARVLSKKTKVDCTKNYSNLINYYNREVRRLGKVIQ